MPARAPAEPITYDAPTPFKIHISDAEIENVKTFARLTDLAKLEHGTLEREPSSIGEYGMPPKTLRALVEHLRDTYDWRKEEKALQDMGEHYKIRLRGIPDEEEGFEMHYCIARSAKKDAIPLLLCHGWPSSFYEFCKIVPLLRRDFHVLMPSLPGFAFSQAPKRGDKVHPWSITKHALAVDACARAAFGENTKYCLQAGDMGMFVVRRIAQLFPQRVLALHLNMVILLESAFLSNEQRKTPLTELDKEGMQRGKAFGAKGTAYHAMNATRPYTVAACLLSPISCLAYLGEKHLEWSGPDTQPTKDEVITECLLFWFTGSLASSVWSYRGRWEGSDREEVCSTRVDVPTAITYGRHEIAWLPREDVEPYFDLKVYKVLDVGGHFLAQEAPHELAIELESFFGQYATS